jgi:beta-phosphoglucomutase-like phosphatase (HAD superfamily)
MRNKLIIFDLDGVLIESRELHYHALNDALSKIDEQFVIQREEHLSVFDGLNTTRKLEMLTEKKGLPTSVYDQVWQDKQTATFELIKQFPKNPNLIHYFSELKKQGIKIAVASNSIRETVKLALISIGVL